MVANRGPELQAICSAFVSMAFIATVLRIYVRLRLVKAFGADDWFMVAATLAHIMFATCAIGGIHYGTGRHMADLSPENIYKAMRYWWLCYIAYCLAMIAAKISIGIFLLRITITKIHHWIIYTVMTLTVITGIVFFFVTLLQCSPISHFWNRSQPGTCVNVEIIIALTYLYGSISAVCDFTFGILPIFLVWNLNMDRKTKIALVPILSMACIASSAVLVRMAYIQDFRSDDFLWATVDIAIWSDTEQGLAITAGSLATLRPLFRIVNEKLGITSGGTSGRKTPSYGKPLSSNAQKRSRTKRRGPFSLQTDALDEEYRLGNVKPIQLSDTINDDKDGWRVNVRGDNESEEELHSKESEPDSVMRFGGLRDFPDTRPSTSIV